MSSYTYVAVDPAGRERQGRVEAPSAEDARSSLTRKKLYVVRIEESRQAPARTGVRGDLFARRKLSAKQLMLFTRQLATLTQVSPLEEALRTIAQQAEKEHVQRILRNVHSGVVEGQRLSEAMKREEESFPALYRAMIAAGESSGTLPQIMERLSAFLERQAQVRSKVLTALAYPVILALVATFVVAALMIFVVPRIVEQFDDVGQQLPFLTRAVIVISEFLAGWWWALLLGLVGLVVLGRQLLKQEGRRLRFDTMLLRVPLFGRLIRDLHTARLARTLSMIIASRVPLLETLKLTVPTVQNRALRAGTEEVTEAIRTGGSLSAALRRTGLFPPLLIYLAASGEASGRLDIMLERAADYMEREFDGFVATALSLLEPAIIVIMGGIVALIVLSILLPILQLDSMAGAL